MFQLAEKGGLRGFLRGRVRIRVILGGTVLIPCLHLFAFLLKVSFISSSFQSSTLILQLSDLIGLLGDEGVGVEAGGRRLSRDLTENLNGFIVHDDVVLLVVVVVRVVEVDVVLIVGDVVDIIVFLRTPIEIRVDPATTVEVILLTLDISHC